MKKIILMIIITNFCLLTGLSQTVSVLFSPDTTINGQLFLCNPSSIKTHFGNIMPLLDKNTDLPDVYILNNTEQQYLRMIFHPGNVINSISEFEIGLVSDLSLKVKKNSSSFESFDTEQQITLGMTKEELLKIKGINYSERIKNDVLSITYVIDNYNKSPFLKKYNMPIYVAEYWFKDDKLIKYHFGFLYP